MVYGAVSQVWGRSLFYYDNEVEAITSLADYMKKKESGEEKEQKQSA